MFDRTPGGKKSGTGSVNGSDRHRDDKHGT